VILTHIASGLLILLFLAGIVLGLCIYQTLHSRRERRRLRKVQDVAHILAAREREV
jgi:hypothetical protein